MKKDHLPGSNPFQDPDDFQVNFPKVRPKYDDNEAFGENDDTGQLEDVEDDDELLADQAPTISRHPVHGRRHRRWLSGPVILVLLLIPLIIVILLVSRFISDRKNQSKETTLETTIQATTVETIAPKKIVTIAENKHYNLRSSPDLTKPAVFKTVGGETYEIKDTVTGEKTNYGDQWYLIEWDGQPAYLIVDTNGQAISTASE